MAGHRRRWPRAVFRHLELAAWVGAAALVGIMAAFVIGVAPPAAPVVRADPVQTLGPVAPAAGVPCIFQSCARPAPSGEPTRLRIRSIGVDTPLEELRLDRERRLEPPKAYDRPGWFRDGIVPGDAGAAVVAGHVDSFNGPAVFYRLHTLKSGDVVEILRGGTWVAFRVTAIEQYPKNRFPSGKVYQPTPDAELRLITCGGTFDPSRRSYRDNIVVYAVGA